MKYSVVLCTYNGEQYIEAQIISIINQTHKVDELVICDDISTDDTLRIVKTIMMKESIPYRIIVNSTRLGPSRNFLNGMKLATGDYVFTCDQDDIWKKDKVEIFDNVVNTTKSMLYFSNGWVINENREKICELWAAAGFDYPQREPILNTLIKQPKVTGAAMMVSRELIDLINDIPLNTLHDYWFSLVASSNDSITAINRHTFYYRQHSNNVVGIKKMNALGLIQMGVSNSKRQVDNRRTKEKQLEELLQLCSSNNRRIIAEALTFWHEMNELNNLNYMKRIDVVLKNIKNKRYFQYSNGWLSAIRDIFV